MDSMAGVEFYPGILIPGMINAHCHLELSYLRGAIAEHTGFAGFAREIGRVRGNYTENERLHAASVADSAMWQEGVEVVIDIANDDLAMPIKEHSKIEYYTLFEAFGLTTKSSNAQESLAAKYKNAGVTPHSTYSLQEAPFRQIAQSGALPLSIHFLESEAETALYNNEGSLWEWYSKMGWECDFLHHKSPARRIIESVPAERRTLVVHNCEATPNDVKLLNTHFREPATWVLCPESNRYISDITPPYTMLREMGAQVAIGTDSLASARHLNMVENMRMLETTPLAEVLSYATINGAKALGIDDKKGSIAIGKQPGLVVISGVDLHKMRLTKESISQRII
jgi:cytosine/adenosine deaminase-related metal-dependent hydrolase